MSNFITTNLVDKNFFEIQGSGISKFKGEKKYLSTSSIQGNKVVSFEEYITYNKRPSRANIQPIIDNVYFAKMRYTFKVIKASKELCSKNILSTGFLGLQSFINIHYLYQFILSDDFSKQKDLYAEGSTQEAINNGDLKNIYISFPQDVEEQGKIAEILSNLDDAIEKTDRLIEKYKKVKAGLMEDLFTSGIDINTGKSHTKFKDSELGRIPESWEEGSIGDFLKVIGGFAFKSIDEVDFGVKWLKIANVGVEKIKWDSICYLPYKYQSTYSDFIIKEGDIVLALTRPLLKKKFKISQVTGSDGISLLNQRVGKVKPYNIVNDFAYYLLNTSNVINLIDIEILGTDPPNISTLQIEEFNISIPKPEEQREIVKILNEASDKIKREEKYKEKLEKIKTGLMKDLLTGKMRVKY